MDLDGFIIFRKKEETNGVSCNRIEQNGFNE